MVSNVPGVAGLKLTSLSSTVAANTVAVGAPTSVAPRTSSLPPMVLTFVAAPVVRLIDVQLGVGRAGDIHRGERLIVRAPEDVEGRNRLHVADAERSPRPAGRRDAGCWKGWPWICSRSLPASSTYSAVKAAPCKARGVRRRDDHRTGRVQRQVSGHRARVDADAQVLACIAHDAQPIRNGFEVDAELRAAEGSGTHRRRPRGQRRLLGRRAGRRIQRVEVARAAEGVNHAVGGPGIDAQNTSR